MPSFKSLFVIGIILSVVAACATPDYDRSLLIKRATIIHPSDGVVAENQCIEIVNEIIEKVGLCTHSFSAQTIIDGRGRWVIPGLWDMHVHAVWDAEAFHDFFADFIAFGVVGIRDMGGTPDALVAARKFLSEDGNLGPELIAAGYVLDGPSPLHPEISVGVETYADGVSAVANLDSIGADFVKIYTTLPAQAAFGIFDEANNRGLSVSGHLPAELDLSDAIDRGMSEISHLAVEIGGLCDVENVNVCRQTFQQLRDAEIYLTPTLVVRQRPGGVSDPRVVARARMSDMPETLRADWKETLLRTLNRRTTSYFQTKTEQFHREQRLTEIAIDEGALILVGTDSGDFLVPPGSSIHEELELLVDSGMDEMAALLAATARATDFLGLDNRGRISVGSIADLVILKSNPLDNIQNTMDIESVVLRGQHLNSARIECLRAREKCN